LNAADVASRESALHAVVVLENGEPAAVVMVYPTAEAAIVWAKRARLDEYRVVPASFGVRIDAPAVPLTIPTL
jgi:hypothetical protein